MKQSILFIVFLLFINLGFSQTLREMEKEAHKELQMATTELNEVYQKILSDYKSDTAFIRNLKTAERNWINYRDSEVNLMLPDFYGSYVLCSLSVVKKFTLDRSETLKQWTKGIEEGDVCTGSRKIKSDPVDEKINITSQDRDDCEMELVQKERISGVKLGFNYNEVTQMIGRPDSIYTFTGPYGELYIVWKYKEELEIQFYVDHINSGTISVTDITSESKFYSTGMNVAVGDSYSKFKKEYGSLLKLFYTNDALSKLLNKPKFTISLGDVSGIQFKFENGAIKTIFLSSYWGPPC
jgi:uncharacterized protein YecT (DUF1311 family)